MESSFVDRMNLLYLLEQKLRREVSAEIADEQLENDVDLEKIRLLMGNEETDKIEEKEEHL